MQYKIEKQHKYANDVEGVSFRQDGKLAWSKTIFNHYLAFLIYSRGCSIMNIYRKENDLQNKWKFVKRIIDIDALIRYNTFCSEKAKFRSLVT